MMTETGRRETSYEEKEGKRNVSAKEKNPILWEGMTALELVCAKNKKFARRDSLLKEEGESARLRVCRREKAKEDWRGWLRHQRMKDNRQLNIE